jgi:DNA repair protein RecO
MKIIVLSITQYKEKDAIINAISEEGAISFQVKSLFDVKSKNAYLNCLLTIADVEFREGNFKYKILKNSTPITSPMKNGADFHYLSALMLISELTNKLLQEDEQISVFPILLETIDFLIKTSDIKKAILFYISNILKIIGYEFEVNSCVVCGKRQNIVNFSFDTGGFVCGDCITKIENKQFSAEQMLLLRSAFNAKLPENVAETDEMNFIFLSDKLIQFIKDSINTNITSFELLKI